MYIWVSYDHIWNGATRYEKPSESSNRRCNRGIL